ncbi:MAG TPA: hypothetical protein VF043_14280 [Ktedonobacteraceae bacterium]
MSGITNWSEALADPCFWAAHYALHLANASDLESFFGRKASHCEEFLLHLYGDEDFETPLPSDTWPSDIKYEYTPASVLGLSFPENYTWILEFGGCGLTHEIYHPQMYPGGLLIAVESGHYRLPGLRWTELKQMVTCCLQPDWPEAFDPQTLYPLLYTVVDPVTALEYDEVRQTLRTAWEVLQVMKPLQLEKWLDASIRVYEKGRVLSYDAAQGWYDPEEQLAQNPKVLLAPRNIKEEDLWLPDPTGGWFCNEYHSMRHDADLFTPFFEMLERHTQTRT